MKSEILIVDDEIFFNMFPLVNEDNSNKFNFNVADNCRDAKLLYSNKKIECVIIDLLIPLGGENIADYPIGHLEKKFYGLDLASYFRNQSKELLIIGYSLANSKIIENHFKIIDGHFINKLESNSIEKIHNLLNSRVIH